METECNVIVIDVITPVDVLTIMNTEFFCAELFMLKKMEYCQRYILQRYIILFIYALLNN